MCILRTVSGELSVQRYCRQRTDFPDCYGIKSETPVYAIVAPAIAGQFPGMENNKIRGAFQALGFTDVREVAVGADLCTVEEAKDFLEEVPEKLPFMATSCCPSWSMMAKKLFPEQAKCISMALTPMVLTARLIKQKEPDCKIVFVGPVQPRSWKPAVRVSAAMWILC